MTARWFIAGTLLYIALVVVFIPLFSFPSLETFFESDASEYSRGAINLIENGFYSIDGVHPFFEREPGYSFFLVGVYALFGIENGLALIIVQAALFFLSSYAFCYEISRWYGKRTSSICFLFLLTSGSILHSVFMANREAFSASLFLLCAATFLSSLRTNSKRIWLISGLCASLLILTFFPILLLPFGIGAVFFCRQKYRIGIIVFLFAAMVPVALWAQRNASYDGKFRVIGNQRTAVMWYVRGEQAERVRGLEPFHCLYAEYISRTWDGRSDACSFNGLMHTRWPKGFDRTADYSDVAVAGQEKIRQNIASYLNFSFYEILELHLPFVGGGMSTSFNVYAAFSTLLLGIGFLFGLPLLFRSYGWIWLLPIAYNTLAYALTDATPRYLVPFLFFYALIAAIGYDAMLKRFSQHS